MIYPDERGVAIMGENGFIGKALSKYRKQLPGLTVYCFDFPSSNVLFDRYLDYSMRETINGFLDVVQWCRDNRFSLVFPSSATVYNKNTSYARCKAILEEIVQCYDIPYLGLRIAAGYGPGESHKGQYASVIYQWVQGMSQGESPIIFGDGTQTRDFIYEDDIARIILKFSKGGRTGFHDIGTGINTSFNDVVATINEVLGTDIKPTYVSRPPKYVPETKVKAVSTHYTLKEGITRMVELL